MNNIFNFRRFGKYFISDARSCVASYGLGMLLSSMMGLIIYVGTIVMGLIFNGEWGGPGIGFRIFTFFTCLIVLTFTMPAKSFGTITEKRFGTQWLMIPASSFEKSLSMILLSAIVMPVIMCTVYFGVDAILCGVDSTCGASLAGSFKALLDTFLEFSIASQSDISQYPALAHFVKQVSCPWLYVDDILQMFLIALLGAIVFKKNKSSMTILYYIAITIVLGLAVTPITSAVFKEFAALNFEANTPEAMNQLFGIGVLKHAALFDTICDTVINLALMAAIYFRVKTLKH
jgi:hypothetical protein